MKRDAVIRPIVAALFPVGRDIVAVAFQHRQTRVFCESQVRLGQAAQEEAAAARILHDARVLARVAQPRFPKHGLLSA